MAVVVCSNYGWTMLRKILNPFNAAAQKQGY